MPSSFVSCRIDGTKRRSRRAKPKSRILTTPSSLTITFSGLRSPCTIPASCATAIPAADLRLIDSRSLRVSEPVAGQIRERLTGDVLHGNDRHTRRIIDCVYRAHVGMIQGRDRPRLGKRCAWRHRAIGLEDLQGHRSVKLKVPRQINPCESPRADLRLNQVMREEMTRPQSGVRVEMRLVGHPVLAAKASRLQGRKHPQNLLATPAHAQAVHDLVLNKSLGIDQKQPSNRDLLPLLVNPVGLRDRAVQVAGQRESSGRQVLPVLPEWPSSARVIRRGRS